MRHHRLARLYFKLWTFTIFPFKNTTSLCRLFHEHIHYLLVAQVRDFSWFKQRLSKVSGLMSNKFHLAYVSKIYKWKSLQVGFLFSFATNVEHNSLSRASDPTATLSPPRTDDSQGRIHDICHVASHRRHSGGWGYELWLWNQQHFLSPLLSRSTCTLMVLLCPTGRNRTDRPFPRSFIVPLSGSLLIL